MITTLFLSQIVFYYKLFSKGASFHLVIYNPGKEARYLSTQSIERGTEDNYCCENVLMSSYLRIPSAQI